MNKLDLTNALSEQNLFILRGLTVGAYVFLPLIACKHRDKMCVHHCGFNALGHHAWHRDGAESITVE